MVVRQHFVDLIPERISVVAVVEVAQFVFQEILNESEQREQALPME
jgi:hypothetical protein